METRISLGLGATMPTARARHFCMHKQCAGRILHCLSKLNGHWVGTHIEARIAQLGPAERSGPVDRCRRRLCTLRGPSVAQAGGKRSGGSRKVPHASCRIGSLRGWKFPDGRLPCPKRRLHRRLDSAKNAVAALARERLELEPATVMRADSCVRSGMGCAAGWGLARQGTFGKRGGRRALALSARPRRCATRAEARVCFHYVRGWSRESTG